MTTTQNQDEEKRLVTVCDKCLTASCWNGLFMCDQADIAGITQKTVAELRTLDREHPCYWDDEKANQP